MNKSELAEYINEIRNKLIPEVESEWRKASDRYGSTKGLFKIYRYRYI